MSDEPELERLRKLAAMAIAWAHDQHRAAWCTCELCGAIYEFQLAENAAGSDWSHHAIRKIRFVR